MNRTTLIASATVVVALGLTAWALRGPSAGESVIDSPDAEDAAKFSNRPASPVGTSDGPSFPPLPGGPARLSNRGERPATGGITANQRLDLSQLSATQRAQIAAAREQQAGLLKPSTSKSQAKALKSKQRAVEKMREDVRTAVMTNPNGWIDTYASLNRDFRKNNGGYFGGGAAVARPGTGNDTSDPVDTTPVPEVPTPDPVDPTDPVEPTDPETPEEPVVEPIELPVPLEEAERLADEYRQQNKDAHSGRTERDDRFKPVAQ
ncbi:MAG: hypothetical protein ACPG4K_04335 [Haloferula sp.]